MAFAVPILVEATKWNVIVAVLTDSCGVIRDADSGSRGGDSGSRGAVSGSGNADSGNWGLTEVFNRVTGNI